VRSATPERARLGDDGRGDLALDVRFDGLELGVVE
jgi:hypothetical protein